MRAIKGVLQYLCVAPHELVQQRQWSQEEGRYHAPLATEHRCWPGPQEGRRFEESIDELDKQLAVQEGELGRNPLKQRWDSVMILCGLNDDVVKSVERQNAKRGWRDGVWTAVHVRCPQPEWVKGGCM